MSPLDRAVLAERTLALERHLARIAEKLPVDAAALVASSDASDAVVLHLWQATQLVRAAQAGPADLRAFVAAIARVAPRPLPPV